MRTEVVLFLILTVCFSFSQTLTIFQSQDNEAFFAVARSDTGLCLAGRTYKDGTYHALLGVEGDFYRLKSESYSYTVESFSGTCLFGGVVLDEGGFDIFLLWKGGGWHSIRLGTRHRDMLWFMRRLREGYALVGGVREANDWDILVVKLSTELEPLWALRLDGGGREYAYGVASLKGRLFVVGRSDTRGNWDAFLAVIDENSGRLLSSRLLGTDRKDYLRFVEVWRDKVLAVGRTEFRDGGTEYPTERNSDIMLLVFSAEGRLLDYRVWGGDGYDYGRVLIPSSDGLFLLGESSSDSAGETDGLILRLSEDLFLKEAFLVGGEAIESIRHGAQLEEDFVFVGYTYSYSLDNDALVGYGIPPCARSVKLLRLYPYIKEWGFKLRAVPVRLRVSSWPVSLSRERLRLIELRRLSEPGELPCRLRPYD